MITLYGISNCDTVKKARKWLIQNNISFIFHDYRKDGITETLLQDLISKISWQELLNKRSTSYRALSTAQKETINEQSIIALFIEYPTLIKRPLLINDNNYLLGFKHESYQALFAG